MARSKPRKAAGVPVEGPSPQERFRASVPRLAVLAGLMAQGKGGAVALDEAKALFDQASEGWALAMDDGSCPADGPDSDAMGFAGTALLARLGAIPPSR